MSNIKDMLANPVAILLGFFIVLLVIKELYEIVKWWKDRADGYHNIKNAKEDFRQQVCEIACTSEKHTETLIKISESLDGINERLDKAEQHRKKDTIASGRATLYHLYEKLRDKDTISLSEYETFDDVANRYLGAGGNSVFRDKIIPEIRNKPVDRE